MLNRLQFFLLTGLGLVALVLAVADVALFTANRTEQNEYTGRAQYIQQSLQLEPVYQGLIRSLAELSAKKNDAQLRDLLASQGITFTASPQEPEK